jgi:sulfate transport system ATP-binding protein
MSIEIKQINKSFGRTSVLNDISLDIPSGQMVALLGPSGSGKTTLLRIIAGLEHQNSGQIRFHNKDVSALHARDRQVGFVFQHYALFRHMTVFDNIAFGLTVLPRRERPSSAEIKQRVTRLLEMVQLAHLANRFPAQLSGGQKQRVALARALAGRPAGAWPGRGRWRSSRRFCCSTNLSARWTRRCVKSCAAGCVSCMRS